MKKIVGNICILIPNDTFLFLLDIFLKFLLKTKPIAAIFSSEDIGAVRYKKKTENIVDVEMKKVSRVHATKKVLG